MKKKLSKALTLSTLIGTLLIFGAGCSKKNVIPPDSSVGSADSEMSGGKDINYPMAGGSYSEADMPVEGSLDDTSISGQAGAGVDQQSEEYKRAHGRCSVGLSPIYFDFDQAGVRPDMTDILVRNSDFLRTKPGVIVVIEGNSDERGTNEYNLALGERRAINAQQYLVNLGIDPRSMRTVSYGEEKPLFQDQNEEAYGMNRRVDFVVK